MTDAEDDTRYKKPKKVLKKIGAAAGSALMVGLSVGSA